MAETEQVMRKIRLEKVVLNMGVGKSGDAITVAKKCLDQISSKKSSQRAARESQRDFGVRKGEPIGVAVTIRGEEASVLFKRLLEAKGNRLQGRSFDDYGNFSFGILEHIDIPGIKYDPQIGILGLDVAVNLARPGFSIRRRSKHKASIGRKHIITAQEAKDFVAKSFGAEIV